MGHVVMLATFRRTDPAEVVPALITALGAALGVVGALTLTPWLLCASLALDVLDGAVARRLNCASERGGLWDWTVDVTVAVLIAEEWFRPWLRFVLPVLLVVQGLAIYSGKRVSGRAVITGVFLWFIWFGGGVP